MKFIRYSKFTGEDLGISAEDLLRALADYLLESGFNSQYMPYSDWSQHTIEDLRAAIQRMLDADEPYVLDIIVPYTEHVLPFIPANRTVADMIWHT